MSTFALILPIFSAMTFSVSSSGLCTFSFYRVSLVLSNHVLFVVFGRIFLMIWQLYSHSIFFFIFLPSLFGMILVWFVTCTVAVSLERRGIHKLTYAPLCSPPGEAHPHPALLGTYTTVLRVGGNRGTMARQSTYRYWIGRRLCSSVSL